MHVKKTCFHFRRWNAYLDVSLFPIPETLQIMALEVNTFIYTRHFSTFWEADTRTCLNYDCFFENRKNVASSLFPGTARKHIIHLLEINSAISWSLRPLQTKPSASAFIMLWTQWLWMFKRCSYKQSIAPYFTLLWLMPGWGNVLMSFLFRCLKDVTERSTEEKKSSWHILINRNNLTIQDA